MHSVFGLGRSIDPERWSPISDPPAALRLEPFSTRLMVPLRTQTLGGRPSLKNNKAVERSNSAVVGFLLQGVDLEALPRPTDERLNEALAPLRMKLDMVIDMLARLSYRDTDLPPLCQLELSPNQLVWYSAQALQPGDWVRFELYF